MRSTTFGMVALVGLMAISKAEAASIQYTATDLGASPRILTNSGGRDSGVVSTDGVLYAFEKTPVIAINSVVGHYDNGQTVLTLQSGTFQVGYTQYFNQGPSPYLFSPSFLGLSYGWDSFGPPVSDINIQGQAIGTSYIFGQRSFAAFSAAGLQSHDNSRGAPVVDNLNNYIATIPGVSLTSAVKVDDLGRIIAVGSDGHDYLLTPTSLGAAAMVPEPSSLFALGTGVLILLAAGIPRTTRLK